MFTGNYFSFLLIIDINPLDIEILEAFVAGNLYYFDLHYIL